MSQDRQADRARELVAGVESRYLLNIVDEGTFCGAVVVRAFGPADAIERVLGLALVAKHTQIYVLSVPPDHDIPESSLDRLLSAEDCLVLGMGRTTVSGRPVPGEGGETN